MSDIHNLPKSYVSPAMPEINYPTEKLYDPMDIIREREALIKSYSFLVKYVGLFVILVILSIGLLIDRSWSVSNGLIFLGVSSLIGYFCLGKMENVYTKEGIELTRLNQGTSVLKQKIRSEERIALARMAYQNQAMQSQLDSCEQYQTPTIQKSLSLPPVGSESENPSHSLSQSRQNQYNVRTKLIQWLCKIYESENLIAGDGRILCTVLWSARGELTPSERDQVLSMFQDIEDQTGLWVVRQDRNGWYLNLDRYSTPGRLCTLIGV